jgi:hypothetical protein
MLVKIAAASAAHTVELEFDQSELAKQLERNRATCAKLENHVAPFKSAARKAAEALEELERKGGTSPFKIDVAAARRRWTAEAWQRARERSRRPAITPHIPRARQSCAGGRRRPGARRVVRSASASGEPSDSEPPLGRLPFLAGRDRLIAASLARIGAVVLS